MSIITLTTDFGIRDYSVAAVKGALLKLIENPVIVDISNHITPYNIPEAAFVLQAAYPNFPKGSIHIIGIDSELKDIQKHLIVVKDGQYFIGADNGVFSLINPEKTFEKIIEIQHPNSKHSSFPSLDVFVDIAAQITFGERLENLGTLVESVNEWVKNKPDLTTPNTIVGHIVYVDHFGNLITDIDSQTFKEYGNNRRFEITASNAKINKIHSNYHEFVDYKLDTKQRFQAGKALAIFNSLNLLEIALFKSDPKHGGSASDLLGLQAGDSIRVEFLEQ